MWNDPNVVFILLDDMSHYGISAYGAKQLNSKQGFFDSVPVSTPQIDRLAEEGFMSENALLMRSVSRHGSP